VLGTLDGQHGLVQEAVELRMFLKDMAPGYGVQADEPPFWFSTSAMASPIPMTGTVKSDAEDSAAGKNAGRLDERRVRQEVVRHLVEL
jgi:hypothetical protein